MKLASVLGILAIPIAGEGRGGENAVTYSGKTDVPGLGTVTFPAGEWSLEFRQKPTDPNTAQRPDYFGFWKVGDTPARLGFFRYDPASATQLSHYMDGILENLGEGAPRDVLGVKEFGESYWLRMEPSASRMKPTDSDIWLSFVNIRPGRPLNWLCHAHLYTRE